MKMRNLLLGVILALLAVVHSSTQYTVTQIPTKAEDEVIREAVTDGFLIDHFFVPSLTTESPKRNTTIQASQQPSSDSNESDMIEGSAVGEPNNESTTSVFLQLSTTTASVSQSSTSTVLPMDADYSRPDSSTDHSFQSSFTSSSVPNEAQSSVTPDHISVSQTTDPAVSSFDFLSTTSSNLRTGDGEMLGQYFTTTFSMTSSSHTETSTASSTSTAALARNEGPGSGSGSGSGIGEESAIEFSTVSTATKEAKKQRPFISTKSPVMLTRSKESGSGEGPGEGSGEGSGEGMFSAVSTTTEETTMPRKIKPRMMAPIGIEPIESHKVEQHKVPPAHQNRGQGTPGWIIILGFIVGVAALVMLFVAIATRDKWNGPSQVSKLETKTNSTNQQRELEMETFLHQDEPRENGKAVEYTVIPLDELPEEHSSH